MSGVRTNGSLKPASLAMLFQSAARVALGPAAVAARMAARMTPAAEARAPASVAMAIAPARDPRPYSRARGASSRRGDRDRRAGLPAGAGPTTPTGSRPAGRACPGGGGGCSEPAGKLPGDAARTGRGAGPTGAIGAASNGAGEARGRGSRRMSQRMGVPRGMRYLRGAIVGLRTDDSRRASARGPWLLARPRGGEVTSMATPRTAGTQARAPRPLARSQARTGDRLAHQPRARRYRCAEHMRSEKRQSARAHGC